MATTDKRPPLFLAVIAVFIILLLLVDRDEFGSYFTAACSGTSSQETKYTNSSTSSSSTTISTIRGGGVILPDNDNDNYDDVTKFANILAHHLEEAESEIAALIRAKVNLGTSITTSRGATTKEQDESIKQTAAASGMTPEALLNKIGRIKADFVNGIGFNSETNGGATSASAAAPVEVNSATGTLFKGEIVRTFSGNLRFVGNWQPPPFSAEKDLQHPFCSKWGVVTTIYDPSLAIARAADMDGWCLVIVADTITPKDYMQKAGLEAKSNTVTFFSVEDQQQWINATDEVGDFTRAVPFKHFARKNLGYLYAIRHGAKFIFDFDDDNIVYKNNVTNTVFPVIPNEKMVEKARVVSVGPSIFNPYPLMSSSILNSWPRGFPLDSIQNVSTQGAVVFEKDIPMDKVGVIQFCADSNPDIDAIHRLVKPLPMNFDPDTKPIIVPSHAFVPYNAQATIHTFPALWATLLPSTVPGRVSDIWRSYFAECLFRELDLAVVFAPPSVEQIRNAHNYLADMKAESDLYFKTSKLIEFLTEWKSTSNSIPGRMEQLWVDLYEREYIEENDVKAVQLWLGALTTSGYPFPVLRRKIHDKVVVMGQFNYAAPTDHVVLWVQKWRELFSCVVVRGRFNDTHLADLQSHGIEARSTIFPEVARRSGWFSPMDNLQRTLQEYKDVKDIEGVLYIHDDALLNLKIILNGSSSFPTQEIIGNGRGSADTRGPSYTDPKSWTTDSASKFSFQIHQNSTFSKLNGEHFGTPQDLVSSLTPNWSMYTRKECLPALVKLATDPRSKPYREQDDSLLINGYTQSDFLYVPTKIADEWSTIAKLFLDSGVYLECSAGPTVNIVRHIANGTIPLRVIGLCTTWGGKRGKFPMAVLCMNRKNIGMVHPIKMGYGLEGWARAFDLVGQGYTRIRPH